MRECVAFLCPALLALVNGSGVARIDNQRVALLDGFSTRKLRGGRVIIWLDASRDAKTYRQYDTNLPLYSCLPPCVLQMLITAVPQPCKVHVSRSTGIHMP